MSLLRIVCLCALVWAASAANDTCNATDTGFTDPAEQAVACYAGNFLTKMLGELNAGNAKTVEHVRVHLLPYLGGPATLRALTFDQPGDATCTVCYTDSDGSAGLTGLRNLLTPDQLARYDALNVCYPALTSRILDALPQSPDTVFLAPQPNADPFRQTVAVLARLFGDSSYTAASCPRR